MNNRLSWSNLLIGVVLGLVLGWGGCFLLNNNSVDADYVTPQSSDATLTEEQIQAVMEFFKSLDIEESKLRRIEKSLRE